MEYAFLFLETKILVATIKDLCIALVILSIISVSFDGDLS